MPKEKISKEECDQLTTKAKKRLKQDAELFKKNPEEFERRYKASKEKKGIWAGYPEGKGIE